VFGNGGPTVAFTAKKQNNQWVTEDVAESEVPGRLTNAVMVGDVFFASPAATWGRYSASMRKPGRRCGCRRGARRPTRRSCGRRSVFSLQDAGDLVIFKVGPTAVEQLHRYKVADSETWTQPLISGNRIFVKDVSTLALWTMN
jgi:hypothetical protein